MRAPLLAAILLSVVLLVANRNLLIQQECTAGNSIKSSDNDLWRAPMGALSRTGITSLIQSSHRVRAPSPEHPANAASIPDNSTKSTDEDARIEQAYLEWAYAHGLFKSVTVGKTANGRGIVATRPMKQKELFAIARPYIQISTANVMESDVGPLLKSYPKLTQDQNLAHAIFFLHERTRPRSFWKPYLDSYPKSLLTPVFMNDEQLAQFQGFLDVPTVKEKQNKIKELYDMFKEASAHPQYRSMFPVPISFEDFRLMYELVSTRHWGGATPFEAVLFTVLEMVNHHPNAYEAQRIENGAIALMADRDVVEGEEVFIAYGLNRSSSDILNTYGFPIDWKYDFVFVTTHFAKMATGTAFDQRKLAAIQRFHQNNATSFAFRFSYSEPIPEAMLTVGRIMSLSEGTFDQDLEVVLGPGKKMLSLDNEQAAFKYCSDTMRQLLDGYPTTLKQDEDILQNEHIDYALRMAVLLRSGRKRIMHRAVDALDERWLGHLHSAVVSLY
eukprot:GILK01012927.1.p1 GENE.GILK01012927.1~~GILK01012927.1.p1  ORF type:complete len:500 (-),score=55.42 GILK01012927.1:10-1509(-)